MATWDGFFNSNFLQGTNWATNTAPDENTAVVIDSTGGGASADPILSSGQIASIFTLDQSARQFEVQGSLSVNSGATLSGTGYLVMASGGTFSVSGSNGLAVIGGTLENNGTVNSTLQISGGLVENLGVISGAVTISGGTLSLLTDSDLSDSAALTVNGGTVNVYVSENVGLLAGVGGEIVIDAPHVLTVGDVGDSTFAGLISGGGGLTKDVSGTLTLTGDNTYTGTTTISEGTLQIGAGGTTGRLGSGDVVNNGALVFDRSDTNSATNFVGNAISGTGTLTVTGGDFLSLLGTNTYSGTTTINAMATLQVSDFGTTGTLGSGDVTNNGVLIFARSDDLTVANVISGSGVVGKFGEGTLILSGANTYSGDTQVYFGILDVTGSLASNVTVFGGSLRVDGAAISNTATVTLVGSGNLTLTGNERIGALASDSADSTVTLGTRTLTTGDAGDDTFAGVISGTGGLIKAGIGTFTLTGNNTYSGTTTINAGTLQIGAGGETGSLGTGAVINNGALVFDRSVATFFGNAISGTGTLTVTAGDFLSLLGTNTYSGTTTINAGGALQVGNDGTTGTLGTGAVTNNGQLAFSRSDDLTVANVISGSGVVSKFGDGTLILSGANTYSGDTQVYFGILDVTGFLASNVAVFGGTLRVDGAAISNTATVTLNNSGNLTLTGNERIGALSSDSANSTVTLGTRTLTTGDAGDDTFAGVISGTGGLIKAGIGTFTLTGDNTYSGTTTINAGTLQIGAGGTTGSLGSGDVINNGALVFDRAGINTVANDISGTGTLTVTAGDILVLTGTNSYSGTTTINAGGALQVGNDGTTGTLGTGAVTNNGQLAFSRSDNLTVANVISGSGFISKFGSGTLILSEANIYTGETFVNLGVLEITGSIASQSVIVSNSSTLRVDGLAISNAATVTLNNSGNLTLTGNEQIGALASGSATTTVTLGANTLTTSNDGGEVFRGVISGTGGLTIAGTSGDGLVLTGTNTFSGLTTINDDAYLRLGTGGTTGRLGGGAIVNDGVLEVFRSNDIVLTKISGTGILSKLGAGTLTLSGINTMTGDLVVAGGTVSVTGSIASQVIRVNNSAILRADGAALSDMATVTLNNSANLTLTGNERIGALASSFATTTVTLGSHTLTTGDAGDDTFAGVISGTGGLTKLGTGTFTLTGANDYSGLTTVSQGTLVAASNSALGTTAAGTTVANGATLALMGEITVAEPISLTGTGVGNGGALRNLSGNNVVDGAITLTGATRINTVAGQLEINGDITGTNTNLTVGGEGITFIAGDILTGTGSLTVDTTTETGIVYLQGANTFTGGTTVNSGFLQLAGGNALANSGTLTVNAPGVVQVLAGETVGALSGSGLIALQTTSALVAGSGTNTTFSGQIIENGAVGAFTKAGTGTLTLSGVNTYTGITTVSAGTLTVANNAGLGAIGATAGTTVSDGATLAVSGGISTGEAITLNGTGVSDGGALRSVSGINIVTDQITLNTASRINADADQLTLFGNITGTNTNLTFGGAGNVNATGNIGTGTGTLTKDGTGTLQLEGTNTFTGNVAINGGSLFIDGAAALADSVQVSLANSTTFIVFDSETIGNLSGAGNVFLGGDGAPVTLTVGDATLTSTFSGVIQDNSDVGSLTKQGSGTLILSGANTFTGATTINGGVLSVTGSLASQTVNVTSGSLRVDGAAISDTATVALSGTGNLTLTGSETVGRLIPGPASATVTLGGHQLTLASQTVGLGTMTFVGSAGVDRLTVMLAPALADFSLVGVNFTTWTEGTDIVTVVGNASANTLTGNGGNNMLNGGLGNDILLGGAGNDTYVVDAAGDQVFETTTMVSGINAGGIDTVESSVTFSLNATPAVRFVENLTLTGTGNINATGNALANTLIGNAGNNLLNGGAGNDIMLGGDGDDTYVVDAAGDQVFETTTTTSISDAGGVDTVQSSVTIGINSTAGLRFVENLILTGTAGNTGAGNTLANRLTGNTGNNVLNGWFGNDTLTGGAGNDTFVFNTALGPSNIDRITDFSVADDTIRLEDSIFVGLATGNLLAASFVANASGQATDALIRIIYETDTGKLFYDADGLGGVDRVQFGSLSSALAVTHTDFIVV